MLHLQCNKLMYFFLPLLFFPLKTRVTPIVYILLNTLQCQDITERQLTVIMYNSE